MKLINRIYPLTAFLVLILFSQASNAIIITNYTALYEDGSKLVVDLKDYDYGIGSYYAPSHDFNEVPFPPIEGFDTFFYPSVSLQNVTNGYIKPGQTGGNITNGEGLYFKVDKYYGVSMTSLLYLFHDNDWSISSGGIHLQHVNYHTSFSGGFFKTSISPYPVGEPGSLALMIIGIAGLGWARQRRKA